MVCTGTGVWEHAHDARPNIFWIQLCSSCCRTCCANRLQALSALVWCHVRLLWNWWCVETFRKQETDEVVKIKSYFTSWTIKCCFWTMEVIYAVIAFSGFKMFQISRLVALLRFLLSAGWHLPKSELEVYKNFKGIKPSRMQFFSKLKKTLPPCHSMYFQTSSLEICSLQWYAEFLSPKLYVVQGRILHRDPRMESLKSKLMEERQEMVKALEEHHSALRIFVPCFQMVFILYLYHFISICYVFACLSIMFIYL